MKRLLLVLAAFAALAAAAPGLAQAAVPTGAVGVGMDGRVELSWDTSPGASAYSVYRGLTPTSITTRLTPTGGTVAPGFADTTAVNGTTYYYAVRSIDPLGGESANSLVVQAAPAARSCSTGNAVVLENCFPGNSGWNTRAVAAVSAGGIEGFATATSINRGESVNLKVNSGAGSTFRVEIYRSGYYGGTGGRLFSVIRGVPGVAQPACTTDNTIGLIDCSNWSVSASIRTMSAWPSGVYLLRLVREDTGADNHILLVVRDDASTSDVFYGVAFTDYQAYNGYGGRSLYDFNSIGSNTVSGTPRAVKVSFDRPYQQTGDNQRDWYPKIDYAMVYWLEQQGFDVSYQSNTDMERSGTRVRNHKAYVMPAHDEYYSSNMRTALENHRNAGGHLFSSGANQVYWRVRFENGAGGQDRILVCYKTVQSGGPDPVTSTSTWRDPAGPNNPENALLGVMYIGDTGFAPYVVSATEGTDRLYRNTGLDTQAPGTSTAIGSQLIGWEWDARVANGFEPAGVKTIGSSPVTGQLIQNNGRGSLPGSAIVHAVKYTSAAGGLVVSVGTNHWNRGLARNVDGVGEPDTRIQQMTINILQDMGSVPATPSADMVLDNPGARPNAPTNVTGTPLGTDSVRISWNAVAGAQGYHVYRSLTPRSGGEPLGTRANASLITGTTFTDIGLSPATQYFYVVTTVAGGTQSLASSEVASTTAAAAGATTRINVGGSAYTSSTGQTWNADTFFSGGNTYSVTSTITGTNDQPIYRDQRWGVFTYNVPVTNGQYDVRLHFAELYYGTSAPGGAGKDVFSMDVVDTPANPDLANIDVYAEVGANAALIKTVNGVAVTDGTLTIQSITGPADTPMLSGLEVIPTSTPAPTVTSTSPGNGAVGVSTAATASATFSRAMDPASITSSTFTLTPSGGAAIPASVAYNSTTRTATLTPSAPLTSGVTYTARLTTGVRGADGVPLASAFTWTFTTVSTGPPTVTSRSPLDGATAVPASSTVRATFSRAMDATTIGATSFTLTPTGGSAVPATVTYDAPTTTATLTPSSPLAFSTTYTARLTTSIRASDGVALASAVTWSFTTQAAAPTVTSTSPVAGATLVLRTPTVSAIFSRDMDPRTIDSTTYTLSGPSGNVAAAVTYDAAARAARLTPAAPLSPVTTYTATLSTGVHAADGSPLAAPFTWSFTTTPCPCRLFDDAAAPASQNLDVRDGRPLPGPWSYELGIKFRTDRAMTLDAARFFKSSNETGTHVARLWTARGQELARTTFTGETAFGWQEQAFPVPVALDPNTVYILSVNANVAFGLTSQGLATEVATPPLRSVADGQNGVFGSAAGLFPTTSVGNNNYYVDPVVDEDVTPAPAVTLTAPAAGAVGVSTGATVDATFSRSLDPASVTTTSFTLRNAAGALVPATVTYTDASRTATLTPSSPLASSGTYTARLETAIRSATGTSLASAHTWSFSTGGAPPTVTAHTPAAGATGVATSVAPTATFSRAMDPATITNTSFTLTPTGGAPVTATVAYNATTNVATLTPSAPLALNTTYTARLETTVAAADGIPLANAFTWSFTTASAPAPTVTATTPANGATGVLANTAPTATFSRAMDPATISSLSFTLSPPTGGPVGATVTYNPSTLTATLTPNVPLSANTSYTAQLATSIRAADGVALAAPVSWSFTTTACPCSLFPNTLTPVAQSLDVRDGRPEPGPWSYEMGVKFTVDQPMAMTALRFYKSPGETGTHIGRLWTAAGAELARVTFTGETASGWQQQALPAPIALDANTTYVASVGLNTFFVLTSQGLSAQVVSGPLRSVVGQNGVFGNAAGTFPTQSVSDSNYFIDPVVDTDSTAAPAVSVVAPADGATAVSATSTATATFSRAMDAATITSSSFTLTPAGGSPVAASVAYDAATRTATLAPSAALAAGTTYTARLTTAVRASNGVALPSAHTWSFTTAGTPPTVTATTPVNGATAVGTNIAPTAAFSRAMNAATITSASFTLTPAGGSPVAATVAYNSGTNVATLTPSAPLANNTTYTARLETSIRAADGMALASAVTWSFTTANAAPTVTANTPANAATGVAANVAPTATFSRAMDATTIGASSFTLTPAGGSPVAATVTYNATTRVATLTPAAPLANNTTYTARLETSIRAADGVALASAFTWSFTTVNAAPTVTATNPASGATGVATNTALTATFNRPMDASTINSTTFTLTPSGGASATAAISYNSTTNVATLTPAFPLTNNTTYTARLDTAVRSADGVPLAAPYSWTFTTINGQPSVVANMPANGATGVATGIAPTATFSRAMDQTTINASTFTLTPAGGAAVSATIAYNASTNVATLTPSAPLANNTTYTARVDQSVRAADGIALGVAFSWSFTTVNGPPTVTTTTPANGAIAVAANVAPTATFSRAMDQTTINASSFTLTPAGGTAVAATVAYDTATNVATLTPSAPLAANTTYTARLETSVRAADGIALASPFTWSFTTVNAAPTVTANTPLAGATGVAPNAAPTATFSRAMDATTIGASSFTLTPAGGSPVAATVAYNATTQVATLTPAAPLANNASYTARLEASIRAADGVALASAFTWSFTTVNAAPTVTANTPLAGATGVAVSAAPTATFSRAMDAASITSSSFTLTPAGGSAVAATVAYNATTNVATLTPSAPLASNTTYTARLDTTVRAADGVALSAAFSWSFTTVNAAPTVTANTPLAGATGVALNVTPTATFSRAMDATTIGASSFTLTPAGGAAVAATVSYDAATRVATLTPAAALATNTTYTARLETTIRAADGVALASAFTWTFTTVNAAPTVTANTPVNGATAVALNAAPTATFSRAMDAATITNTSFTLTPAGGVAVAATVAYNATTQIATLTPSAPLANNTSYTARLETTIRAADGVALATAFSWSFTTINAAPTVTATTPLANATGVPVNVAPTATFSRAMNAATITSSSFTLRAPTGPAINATVTYDAATRIATLTPAAALANNTVYTARLQTTITAADGVPIASTFTWSFTTASAPAPTVTANTPTNGATGVAVNVAPTATFSRAMDATTITTASFTLTPAGGSPVAAAVAYNSTTNVATLTPSAPLANATVYTATLTTTVKSADGVALASAFSWSFTTVNAAPTVTARTPADAATGVATTVAPTATFSRAMDATTIGASSFTLTPAGGSAVPATVAYDAATRVATLTPAAPLATNTTYTARLETTIRAADGVALATAVTWTFTTVAAAPTVTANTPLAGATGVAVNVAPTATFSRAMDATTIGASSFTLTPAGGSAVPATVSYDAATRVATLTPAAPLATNTTYTARLETTVRAADGVALASPFTWSFTTVNAAPTVTANTPLAGATGVALGVAPTATFSRAMDGTTIGASSFTLTPSGGTAIAATVTYDAATRVATLTPAAPLANNTTYAARLETTIRAADGIALASAFTWSFTTVNAAPTVTANTPLAGATGVALNVAPTATFSRAMDATTIASSSFTLTPAGGTAVAATVAYNTTTQVATLTPAAPLANNTTYTARLETTIRSADGVALASAHSWSFTTVNAAPTVTANTPVNGATGVATNVAPTATFSRAMDATTIGASSFTLTPAGGTAVSATVSYDAATRVATLTPAAPLATNTTYTARLETSIRSADGVALAAAFTWSFTTVNAAPTVTANTPANGATGVATNVAPSATFSRAMDATTIGASSFTLTPAGGTAVAASVAYNATTRVATLTPSAPLATNTTYTARLETTIRAADGVALASAFSWSFTTVNAAPTVTANTPANGATGVATGIAPSATFSRAMDATTIGASSFTLTAAGGAAVPATVTYDAATRVATLTPAAPLANNTSYTARLTTSIRAADGVALASEHSWSFTTVNGAPTITANTPANGVAAVALGVNPTATFSRAMDAATITSSSFTLTPAGGSPVAAAVTYDATTRVATLVPSAQLANNTTYTARLETSIRAADGVALASAFSWSFTTVNAAPTVTASTPANGATGVAANVAPTATFSRAMDATTIGASSFTLTPAGGTPVTASVSYDSATRIATLTPSTPLAANTTYTARLETTVRAADGVALASPFTWSFTTVNAAPTVTANTPANSATGVALNVAPTATFSRAMDASTITSSSFTLTPAGGSAVATTVAYNTTTRVATLTPAAPLANNTTYTARLETTISAADGVALASAFTWSFTTVNAAPTVTANTPANGATGVATGIAPSATFSRAMDATTIGASSFTLTPAGGTAVSATVSYDAATRVATLTPAAPLANNTSYTARLETTIRSADGVALASAFAWNFTTVNAAPTVTANTPANGATGVAANVAPTATFSRAMDASTITSSSFTLTPAGGTAVAATVAYNGTTNVATLTPSAPLTANTTYTARLATTIRSADSVALASAFSWSFTTVNAAPTVTASTPAGSATGVATNVAPTATFSRSMDAATITSSSFTLTPAGGTAVAATIAYNGTTNVATLTPSAPLATNTTYTARLETSIRSADGVALAGAFTWSFTTVNAAPSVTARTPADGATGISIAATPTATFSRAMDASTITSSSFTLTPAGGSPVAASVAYDAATRIATLTPTSGLLTGTIYTARLDTSVKAADGVALASAVTWSFTTANAAPTVTARTPADGATGLAVGTAPTATFSRAMDAASITSSSFTLTPAGGSPVAATVAYDAASRVATLTPAAPLANSTTYTARLTTDVKAADGVALASAVSWSFTTVNAAPSVTANTPANGAAGIALGAAPTATFSRAMDAATITPSSFTLTPAGGSPVTATVGYDSASRVATLTPSAPLAANTTYTARLTTDVRAADGVALAAAVSWSFTTVNAAPTVTSSTPADGATGVATSIAPTATFSRAMDTTTIGASSFTLTPSGGAPVAATVSYDAATRVATLTPASGLAPNTTYTARLDPSIRAADGVALASAVTWSFTTVNAAPTVTANTPADGATGVAINVAPTATFSRAMDAASLTNATFTLTRAGAGAVIANVTYDPATRVATLTPTSVLAFNTSYTARLDGTVRSADGVALGSAFSWSFTTVNAPPTVTATTPANGATAVATSTAPTATFSRAMDATTIGASSFTLTPNGGSAIAATVSYDAATRVATLTPASALAANTTYTARLSTDVRAADGMALASAVSWSFTTLNGPPTVTANTPTDGATGVAINVAPTATFSRAMDASTLTDATFTLTRAGAGAVNATVTYDPATRVATLTPTSVLAFNTVYTARIDSSVRAGDGVALASAVSWSFTTISGPPTVTATTPADGATGVATSIVPTATFSRAMDATTIGASSFTLTPNGGSAVAATVSYDSATRVATITPASALAPNTTYTARLDATIRAADGVALASAVSWSFTTLAAAPTVTANTPADGATGVAIDVAPTATFSRAMDAATLTSSTFTLTRAGAGAVIANVTYDPATRVATLTPTSVLAFNTTYTARLDTAVRSADGVALASAFTWSFTTVAGPPTVTASTPADGATGVATGVAPTATFSRAMDATTIGAGSFTLTPNGGSAVSATVSYDAATRVATLTPASALAANTTYTARLDTTIRSADGVELASPVSWSFTTLNGPPTVTANTPASGASGIAISVAPTATFSRAMDAATLTSSTFTLTRAGAGAVTANVTYDPATRVATLTPTSVLAFNTSYTARLTTGVRSADGVALGSAYTWSFTTATSAAPTVTANTPAAGATGTATNTAPTATFSRTMDATTIGASSFTLTPSGGSAVPATVSYNATTRVATLTPATALANSTTYTATLSTAIRASDGVPLSAPFSWSFTTAGAAPPTTLAITSTSPSDGATEVAPSNSPTGPPITATFSQAVNATTVTTATYKLLRPDGTQVPASPSYNSTTMTATLVATTPLAYSTTYTVVATTGITATSGAALAAETRWSFTTTGVPKAVRINSGGGAYSGSTGQWDADAQFRGGTVRTVTSAISNTPDPSLYQNERNGAWLYNVGVPAGTYDVVLHFAETLKTGAGQRVFHVDILDTAAVNDVASLDVFAAAGGANRALVRTIAGVTVTDGTVSISPKTVTDLPTISAIEVIPVLPTATAWTPSTGATNVAAGVAPTVTFSRAMNAASINANTVTLQHSSGALVAATVAYDAGTRVATLTPSAALTGGTYTARVDGSVMAADGMTMGSPATWSFSTAYGAPTVTSATPADGATGVALDVEPTAGFSREMDATTIGGSSFTLTPAGGTAVAATVAYDAATRTATLTPAAPLTASTVYTAKLETTIKASDGAALDSAVQWSFTTSAGTGGSASAPNGSGETPSGSTQEPAPTTDEAPTVTEKTPAADAVDVELDVAPTAKFSIAMDESSIDGTSVTIRAGDTAVEATVSYDAETRIVKVTPKAALEPGTKYDVRLGTGIKSADGVALAGAVSWSFTTK